MSELRIVAGRWRGRRIKVPPAGVRPTADRVREAWMSIVQPHIPDAIILDLCAGSGALGLEALSRGAEHCHFVESDPKVLRILQENIATLGAGDRSTVHRMKAGRFLEMLTPSGVVQETKSEFEPESESQAGSNSETESEAKGRGDSGSSLSRSPSTSPSTSPSPSIHPSPSPLPLTSRSFPSLLDLRASRALAFADPPYARGIATALATYWLNTPFAAIFGIEHEAKLQLPAPSDPQQSQDTRRYGDTALTFYRVSP